MKDISQQVDMLKRDVEMLKVSDIKLDLKKGTMHLSILASQKSSVICEIIAMAYKIKDIIQNYKLVYKLRKRWAEEIQCKKRIFVKLWNQI